MKNITLTIVPLIAAIVIGAPQAFAAKYYLSDNDNLVKGCSGTIEIGIDTEGANILAGDSTILVDSRELKANQLSIGPALPMQVFSQISSDSIKLSGARIPMSGSFNGNGILGYINFTPNQNADTGTFTFSPDLNTENNLIDDTISNVLTSAAQKTYVFKDPYNKSADGTGFCTPDTTPPTVQFITPPSSSANNSAGTDIIFAITDNRAGVDINSLQFTINGVDYNKNSSQVFVQKDADTYRVATNPNADFNQGANVNVNVNICDLNSPKNCTTSSEVFRISTPTQLPPVCGDGIINYLGGEQCDDGNTRSGDGCSSLCLYELPSSGGASCGDGLQNQGEAGIDCGGSCPNQCPTCVDGIMNQGETGVDCGGPCPACGICALGGGSGGASCPVTTQSGRSIIICHYPTRDSKNPISLEINESSWPQHLAHGDTLGACPTPDACLDTIRSAAPGLEQKALDHATTIIQDKGVTSEQKTVVTAPKVITEVVSQIDICKADAAYETADFDNSTADTDGDGLSDRMECYAGTNPTKKDTDEDGCSDYEELNSYFTNPHDPTDCKSHGAEKTFSDVLITDPQPGWILSTKQPSISGKAPENTVLVLIVATQSEQTVVKGMLDAVESVLNLPSEASVGEIQSVITKLDEETAKAKTFLAEYGKDFNSDDLTGVINSIPADPGKNNITGKNAKEAFEEIRAKLTPMQAKPEIAAASTQLSETSVSEFSAKNFEEVSNPLKDKQLYDLVATAYLSDGTQISSRALRFSVNLANTISKPMPRTIGGKLIPSDTTAFNNLFIADKAFAQDGGLHPEITIDAQRPSITGETEFGSQVFAIWNSVVLASSVISDSEQGAFEVQAPHDMEIGVPHRVTLYAVRTEDNNKIRSESVDVFFIIKKPGAVVITFVATVSLASLLAVVGFVIRRLAQRRYMLKLFKK